MKKLIALAGKRRNWAVPYMLFLAFFVLVPLLLIAYYGFTKSTGGFTFEHFRKFGSQHEAVHTLVFSIGVALVTTVICLLIGYPAALILSRMERRIGRVLVLLFILPMWINFLIRTLATVALFDFLKIPLGQASLYFGMVYNFLPFMIYPIYNTLLKTENSLLEAAQDMGATPVQVFTRVTLPLSVPGISSGIMMVFMPVISTFAIAEILTLNNIKLFGTTLQENIYNGLWNYGAALSLVMLLLIGITSLLNGKGNAKAAEEGGLL